MYADTELSTEDYKDEEYQTKERKNYAMWNEDITASKEEDEKEKNQK